MDETSLPPAPPAGPEVESRVLAQVLDRLELAPGTTSAAPPPRRGWVLPAAAAALVVAVAGAGFLLTRAPSATGPATPPAPATSTGVPASGSPVLDEALQRCADLVRSSSATGYPPVEQWTASDSLPVSVFGGSSPRVSVAVAGRFFCSVTPATVSVSAVAGPAVGPVQLVAVAPGLVGVLNPAGDRLTIGTDEGPASQGMRADEAQLWTVPDARRATTSITVDGGPQGAPLPEPAPLTLTTRTPFPAPDRTSSDGALLARCLEETDGDEQDAWSAVVSMTLPDGTRVLAARAPGGGAVCAVPAQGTPAFIVEPLSTTPTDGMLLTPGATSTVDAGEKGTDTAVYSVDPRAVTLTATGTGRQGQCVVTDGIGVCVRISGEAGPVTVTARDADGTLVAGPLTSSL